MSIKGKIRKLGLILVALVILCVAVLAVLPRGEDAIPPAAVDLDTSRHETVAVFGATGTVGDGLLKAAMHDRSVEKIHVIGQAMLEVSARGRELEHGTLLENRDIRMCGDTAI